MITKSQTIDSKTRMSVSGSFSFMRQMTNDLTLTDQFGVIKGKYHYIGGKFKSDAYLDEEIKKEKDYNDFQDWERVEKHEVEDKEDETSSVAVSESSFEFSRVEDSSESFMSNKLRPKIQLPVKSAHQLLLEKKL